MQQQDNSFAGLCFQTPWWGGGGWWMVNGDDAMDVTQTNNNYTRQLMIVCVCVCVCCVCCVSTVWRWCVKCEWHVSPYTHQNMCCCLNQSFYSTHHYLTNNVWCVMCDVLCVQSANEGVACCLSAYGPVLFLGDYALDDLSIASHQPHAASAWIILLSVRIPQFVVILYIWCAHTTTAQN